jgi:hypothetical protein
MKSSAGSPQWTEGAVSVSDAVTDKLRVGIQFHMYQMGQFGGPNVIIDWASGDYKINDFVGFRFGKIKTPLGLFNESQDVDSLFPWVLLPQAMYPNTNRDFDLSERGGEVYGSIGLGEDRGRLAYHGHIGSSVLDANGGYVTQLQEMGLTFPSPPSGPTGGGDLRWNTPWLGLSVGASALVDSLDGTGPQGSFHLPQTLVVAYYAQSDWGKLHLAGEYWKTPLDLALTMGSVTFVVPTDSRAWYPMVSYEVTKKLQAGTYYSHYANRSLDPSLPAAYSRDWTICGRYNFSQYFYAKVEGHFLHGTALGYYTSVNPEGLKTNSNMLAARIGFSF